MGDLIKIHLGCGSNIIPGWLNCDIERHPDILYVNLKDPLPFLENKADYVFMEHVIEHFTLAEGRRILSEICRVLRPGGVLRISTPDLNVLAGDYRLSKTGRWETSGWLPQSPAQMLNEGMRNWGHEFLYDEYELTNWLRAAGFQLPVRSVWGYSPCDALQSIDSRPRENSDLIMEAMK